MKKLAFLENFAPAAVKGLGYAAGAAIPTGLLMMHARHQADEASKNLRNQALIAALGLGGLGLGTHALANKLTPKNIETEITEEGPMGPSRVFKRTRLAYDAGTSAAMKLFNLG
jgi:hypothetical protein